MDMKINSFFMSVYKVGPLDPTFKLFDLELIRTVN